jgi:hypothetical protein
VGTTSSPHGPYVWGVTHATIAGTAGRQRASASQSPKAGVSPDCRLQLACMKSELLVTARQHSAVNAFPGLVHTARHTTKAGKTRRLWANPSSEGRQGLRVGSVIGVKS